jgi:cation diffusion facilitator CzcD-associated flavoprotein CzcO
LNALTNPERNYVNGSEVNSDPSRFTDCDVAIIGAGPYGLAAASYLTSAGVDVRVFGEPMDFWAHKMPIGMLLRSPRVASNIADPHAALTLEAYERIADLAPRAPLPLETFVKYGQWFTQHIAKKD